jgi:hypothetical protein
MRISTLLLFLSGLLAAGVAPARGQATADSLQLESSQTVSPIPSLKFDLANADSMAIDQYRLPKPWDDSLGRLALDNVRPEQDQVCYTLRSYKVEKTERVNESTQPMKYSTCQPSTKFDVKNADVHVVGPEGPQEQP